MTGSTSTALVPVGAMPEPAQRDSGCGGKRSAMAGRTKWLILAAVALAASGLALGSSVLGFAAMLPLLYTLPCLLMLAMCMKGSGKAGAANSDNAE